MSQEQRIALLRERIRQQDQLASDAPTLQRGDLHAGLALALRAELRRLRLQR